MERGSRSLNRSIAIAGSGAASTFSFPVSSRASLFSSKLDEEQKSIHMFSTQLFSWLYQLPCQSSSSSSSEEDMVCFSSSFTTGMIAVTGAGIPLKAAYWSLSEPFSLTFAGLYLEKKSESNKSFLSAWKVLMEEYHFENVSYLFPKLV